MEKISVDLAVTGLRGRMINDYLEGKPALRDFYTWTPNLESFYDVIEARKKQPINRAVLVEELLTQHTKYFNEYPVLRERINSLANENAFTVTTGHQLCLAGGPLFFLYKIITTINLAKQLSAQHSNYQFVPVFWLASEDHDFDEINSVNIQGKTVSWEKPTNGATGKISTESLKLVLEEIKLILGEQAFSVELNSMFEKAYIENNTLADATRSLALSLFAKEGLIVIDADRPSLKQLFKEVFKKELKEQFSFAKVSDANQVLEKEYTLPVSPRPLNLFYLDDQLRERIVKSPDGNFEVVNTDLKFSEAFIIDLADSKPEKFSPNVILRPVYQEMILPNLAYVGGPAEASYFLQFKKVFDYLKVFFPMVIPRAHALMLSGKQFQKFTALGFKAEDLFASSDDLINRYLKSLDDQPASLDNDRTNLQEVFAGIKTKLVGVDQTLEGAVQAELQKALNGFENIEKKMQAALKRKNETAVNLIKGTIDKTKPGGKPQERVVNFSTFYVKSGRDVINQLSNSLHPFDASLTILLEN